MNTSGNKRKKYFPNRVKEWSAIDAELLEPIEFDEFMEWRVLNWEINPEYSILMREYIYNHDGSIKKVTARDYKRPKAAMDYIKKNIQRGEREYVLVNHESIRIVSLNNDFSHYTD